MATFWRRAPGKRELREFGVVVGSVIVVAGALLAWRASDATVGRWLLGIGTLLVAGGIVAPLVLTRPFQVWMAFAFVIGTIMSRLLLVVFFATVICGARLVLMLLGRDPLEIRWRPGARDSYWMPREDIPIPRRHRRPF